MEVQNMVYLFGKKSVILFILFNETSAELLRMIFILRMSMIRQKISSKECIYCNYHCKPGSGWHTAVSGSVLPRVAGCCRRPPGCDWGSLGRLCWCRESWWGSWSARSSDRRGRRLAPGRSHGSRTSLYQTSPYLASSFLLGVGPFLTRLLGQCHTWHTEGVSVTALILTNFVAKQENEPHSTVDKVATAF